MTILGLGLGLQGLYSATNCADNILGRFTIILQNQIARVDSFTNLTKRWVFRFRLNASVSGTPNQAVIAWHTDITLAIDSILVRREMRNNHTEALTKWPASCRRHFQIHFIK